MLARGTSRTEDANARTEFRQGPEALDELRLDPKHPPRVGVHPGTVASPGEQTLVGRGRLYLVMTSDHRPLGSVTLAHGWHYPPGGALRREREARTARIRRTSRGSSSRLTVVT